jgi:ParB/Sulfiredoxin domain
MGNKHDRTATLWVPLAEIRISERRARSINAAAVERYRLWLEQGLEAPAVRLARDGDGYVVRDGRHRVAAALAAGHAGIEAEIQPSKSGSAITRLAEWCRRLIRRRALNTGVRTRRRRAVQAAARAAGREGASAPVAQMEEHRASTPGAEVRLLSGACQNEGGTR